MAARALIFLPPVPRRIRIDFFNLHLSPCPEGSRPRGRRGAQSYLLHRRRHGVASILTRMGKGETIEAGMIGLEGVVRFAALIGAETSGQHVLVQARGISSHKSAADCMTAFECRGPQSHIALHGCPAERQHANCCLQHSLQQRTARWLLMMHDRLQSDPMPLTHEFLSTMLGVRRTRITEAAGTLQRLGLIGYARGFVTVLDHSGLSAIACECYRDHDRLYN